MPQSPPCSRPPRTTAGFTLLEILIAIVLLVIVIGAVMALQVGGLRANKDTVNLQNSVAISRDVVEQLRSNPQNIPTMCATGTTTTTQQQGSSTQYTVSCTSTPCSVGSNTTDLDALLTQTPTCSASVSNIAAYRIKLAVQETSTTKKILEIQSLVYVR